MVRVAMQSFGWRATARLSRSCRQRLSSGLPNGGRRLDTYCVLQSEFTDDSAELRTVPIGCIRQNHSHWNLLLNCLPHLLQRNRRLGLEPDLFGDARLAPALGILTPRLRQIQTPGDGETRIPCAYRQTHGSLTVILLTDLTAVLPGNSHGVFTLLGEAGIVYDPRHHRAILLHGG